ncbi:MAG: sugar ABC transporter ATP-binding protein [Bacillota bacterium]
MDGVWVLQMKGISKEYGENAVLKGVSLDVKPGEVHALIGENGAGKSTLMNILFGMPVIQETGGFRGEIRVNGVLTHPRSPRDAMDAGVGMVHQEFMLLPGFSVTENIKLNREMTRPSRLSGLLGKRVEMLDYPAMGRDARRALDRVEMAIGEWLPVAGMPVGYRQFVEIAREIDKKGISLLVFDEPTAVLAESEATHLLKAIRTLAASGVGVLFISHRLEEVMEVAERITVLRDGEVIATIPRSEARVETLAEMMVGRALAREASTRREVAQGDRDPVLQIQDLKVDMPGENVTGANLTVRRGEILGIAGLAGQGKIGIANGIAGLRPSTGRMILDGRDVPLNSPRASLQAGLVFLSEDRRGMGLLLDDSIEDNITAGALLSKGKFLRRPGCGLGFLPASIVDRKAVRGHAVDMISSLDIKCTGPEQKVRRLSGGNQQKVCVAKALAMDPKVLMVSEPTRGIDVGAKARILGLLTALNREQGMTIIVTSSELAELRRVCDRIAITYQGKISAILEPGASDAEFGLCMAGRGRTLSDAG